MQMDKIDMNVEQSVSMHSRALERPCKRQIVTDLKSRNVSHILEYFYLCQLQQWNKGNRYSLSFCMSSKLWAKSLHKIEFYSELKSLIKYWYVLVSIFLPLVNKVNKIFDFDSYYSLCDYFVIRFMMSSNIWLKMMEKSCVNN